MDDSNPNNVTAVGAGSMSISFKWTRVPLAANAKSPVARQGHSLGQVGTNVWLFGGYAPNNPPCYKDDVWSFDTEEMCWNEEEAGGTPPSGRLGHTATPVDVRLFVFGGFSANNTYTNDVHVLNVDHQVSNRDTARAWGRLWEEVKGIESPPNSLPPRRDHTATLVGSRIIIFGGFDASSGCMQDTDVLYRKTMQWSKPPVFGNIPQSRRGHTACLVDCMLYCIGGVTFSEQYLNDVVVLDTKTMEWRRVTCNGSIPEPRAFHTAVTVGQYIIVWGGKGRGLSDVHASVHVLDTEVLVWHRVATEGAPKNASEPDDTADRPMARYGHSAAVVPSAEGKSAQVLIFGGVGKEGNVLDDTWMLETGLQS